MRGEAWPGSPALVILSHDVRQECVGTFYRRVAAQIPVGGAVAGAGVAGRFRVMFQQPESVESWSRGHEQTNNMSNVLNV